MDNVLTPKRPAMETIDAPRREWISRWRPRTAVSSPLLAGYVGSNFWKRHRRALFLALGLFGFLYGGIFALFTTFVVTQLAVPLVVLVAVIIWILPETGKPPLRWIGRLLTAFIITVICWPNYLALALPGMPWITVVRLIGIPLALVLLLSLSLSKHFRQTMVDRLSAVPAIWKMLAGFMAIGCLTIFVSVTPGMSASRFFVAQLSWTLMFACAAYVYVARGRATELGYILWTSMVFVELLGVWEWRVQHVPWAEHIPSFLRVDQELLDNVLTTAGRAATGLYRVRSVFTTSLALAEYIAFTMPFVIHILFTTRKPLVRVLAMLTFPLTFFILVGTDSRLGMVGFFMSFLLYLFAWAAIRRRRIPNDIIAPLIVWTYPAIFCIVIAASFFVRRLHSVIWGSGAQTASNDSRREQLAMGLPKILSQPWGYGMGRGGPTVGFLSPTGTLTIDNYWLAVALEYGIIGFFLYYGMFAIAIYQAGRHALLAKDSDAAMLTPMAIMLLNFVLIKTIFSQEGNHALVFVVLGAIVALVFRVKAVEAGANESTSCLHEGPLSLAARETIVA